MSESNLDQQRRKLLKLALMGLAAVPLGTLVAQENASGGELQHLSKEDPIAKALNYFNDAPETGSGDRLMREAAEWQPQRRW